MNKFNVFSLQAGLAALLVCTVCTRAFAQSASTNAPPFAPPSEGPTYRPGEVLVKFRNDVTDAQIEAAFRGAGLRMLKHIRTPVMERAGDIGITRALTQMPVEQAAALLSRLPGVEYAEPNWIYTHQALSNDPYFTGGQLWGMYGDLSNPKNVYGSQAAEAWASGYIGSKAVVIGVIDEGIQFDHPELEANIWTNPGETPGDGIDNDENGKIDDVNGWNFITDDNSIYDAAQDDHGTHVAGTIGAVGGNGAGVAGVNWAVSIIPAKFLGPEGGSTTDAIEAVDYFTDLKHRGINIVALNNSWGGGGYSQGLHEAIIRAAKEGILFVAAAGNGNPITGRAINIDSSPVYPACYNTTVGAGSESPASYDSVICVTAIDSAGRKASFANYGATAVDLGAPGVNIMSTLPGDNYGAYNGTSMATPHVTGGIGLYASTHPDASALEMRNAILNSTTLTSSLSGKTVTGGRLDLSTIITPPTTPPTVPNPPSAFAGQALSHSEIRLTWNDNSGNETRFEITRRLGDNTEVITVGADSTSFVDSGLSANTTYTYGIKACNSLCSAEVGSGEVTTLNGPNPASASPVGSGDKATQGTWRTVYGGLGYHLYRFKGSFISGLGGGVSFIGASANTWADPTTELPGLQYPDTTTRFADCVYAGGSFTVDVDLPQQTHVSLYFLDWDDKYRAQDVTVIDANYPTSILNKQSISEFRGGVYLTWLIKGHVQIRVTRTEGDNAVLSGLFFDAESWSQPIPPPTPEVPVAPSGLTATAVSKSQINLTWVDNSSNEEEFIVERSRYETTGFTPIITLPANTTKYSNTGLARNTTYFYRVQAKNSGGANGYSNVASATTPFR